MRRLDVPVGIHHAGRLLEDRLDLRRHLRPPGGIGSVDFGHQRLQHGRSRRHLGHLQRGAERPGDRQQPVAHAPRHVVALRRPLAFRHEVHLQVGQVRRPAQKVVTHEPVEVVRRRRADVLLHVDDGLVLQRGRGQGGGDTRRGFEGRALRHVDHHLELALVVEGQHLDRHQLERHERHGGQQQHRHAREKQRAHPAARDERAHHAPIETREEILLAVVVMGRRLQEPHRRPRCHHERPRRARRPSPPTRRPESAACTGPSGRRRRPWAEWPPPRRASPGWWGCPPRPRREASRRPVRSTRPCSASRAARCSPPPRSHRPRGCRWRRSGRTA